MGAPTEKSARTGLPLVRPRSHIVEHKSSASALFTRCVLAFCIIYAGYRHLSVFTHPWELFASPTSAVQWKSCGDGYGSELQCANISVPLDYRNENDTRTIQIAVTRLLAANKENRGGAVFTNPGGPGGSGSTVPYTFGKALAKILNDQYDIIGFDPRGVNLTRPSVSCFESQLELEAFQVAVNNFALNIPSNLTAFPNVHEDVARQVNHLSALSASLVKKCGERTGEWLQYMGTEFVVRDIDTLSRLIEGPEKKINYWGLSYGTVIGQYMVKVLAPERLGKLVIDGVVNVDIWNSHSTSFFDQGLQDSDKVLLSFATSCLDAGAKCALGSPEKLTSPASLLSKIDGIIDTLYAHPAPVYDIDVPAVVSAGALRLLLLSSMYDINSWGALAENLNAALAGNYTGIAQIMTPRVQAGSELRRDRSAFSTAAIICADSEPFSEAHPPPTDADVTDLVFRGLDRYSRRFGDAFWWIPPCKYWEEEGSSPKRSRYEGTFELIDDTLDTPMLILTSTYDPVTPLEHATEANKRLGNNARLIQQMNGSGHCTISQVSYCTMRAVRQFFLEGVAPVTKHTACEVDQIPFEQLEADFESMDADEKQLREATRQLAADWRWNRFI